MASYHAVANKPRTLHAQSFSRGNAIVVRCEGSRRACPHRHLRGRRCDRLVSASHHLAAQDDGASVGACKGRTGRVCCSTEMRRADVLQMVASIFSTRRSENNAAALQECPCGQRLISAAGVVPGRRRARSPTRRRSVLLAVHSPDRKAERPASHLGRFKGILQVDGYAGFERLTAGARIPFGHSSLELGSASAGASVAPAAVAGELRLNPIPERLIDDRREFAGMGLALVNDLAAIRAVPQHQVERRVRTACRRARTGHSPDPTDRRTTGVVLRGTQSLLTRRWRKVDSNLRYLSMESYLSPRTAGVFCRLPCERQAGVCASASGITPEVLCSKTVRQASI